VTEESGVNDERHLLYERLYNQVLADIRAGTLRAGDRVPSEKELAQTHGVSRVTSMRALQMLERAGLVARIRGKGTFVVRELPRLPDPLPGGERPGRRSRHDASRIAFLIPDASQAFGLELLNAVEERAGDNGLSMILKRTRGRQDDEERTIDRLVRSGQADGLIVFPVHGEFYNASLLRLVLESYPIVLVDRYLQGIAACSVYTDNRAAALELTGHLLDNGHQQLAFVSPPPKNTSSIEDRLEGFRTAFSQRGLGPAGQHLLPDLSSTLPDASAPRWLETDRDAICAFAKTKTMVTGYVACEYNVALMLRDVLRELGRENDATIVCFDSPGGLLAEPPFTHIKQDEREMGHRAVDLLMAQLRGEQVTGHSIVPHTLVVTAPGN
jgi:DNA-binding LacI/PurR family transcriptional regulator